MTRRLTHLLTTALVGALLAVGSPAHAQDYSFPDSCRAIDIAQFNPDCTASAIDVTVDADGQVVWERESAYPRAAFDSFMTEIDGFTGTTEEYLDSAQKDVAQEPGASFTYEATDATVVATIGMNVAIDTPEAGALGVTSDGEFITISMAVGAITDATTVTATVPGRMLESNGTIDGSSATWTGLDLQSVTMLTARGEAEPRVDSTRWLVAGAVLVIAALLVAWYLLVWRRRPDGTLDPIDLDPEYAGETDDADRDDIDDSASGGDDVPPRI